MCVCVCVCVVRQPRSKVGGNFGQFVGPSGIGDSHRLQGVELKILQVCFSGFQMSSVQNRASWVPLEELAPSGRLWHSLRQGFM